MANISKAAIQLIGTFNELSVVQRVDSVINKLYAKRTEI